MADRVLSPHGPFWGLVFHLPSILEFEHEFYQPCFPPPDVPYWVRMTETFHSLAASRTLHEAVL